MATTNRKKVNKPAEKKVNNLPMVFNKQNYRMLIISLAVIVLGFIVMGSGKDKPFDDPIKITVAPIIVLIGFALGVYSILHSPKSSENQETDK